MSIKVLLFLLFVYYKGIYNQEINFAINDNLGSNIATDYPAQYQNEIRNRAEAFRKIYNIPPDEDQIYYSSNILPANPLDVPGLQDPDIDLNRLFNEQYHENLKKESVMSFKQLNEMLSKQTELDYHLLHKRVKDFARSRIAIIKTLKNDLFKIRERVIFYRNDLENNYESIVRKRVEIDKEKNDIKMLQLHKSNQGASDNLKLARQRLILLLEKAKENGDKDTIKTILEKLRNIQKGLEKLRQHSQDGLGIKFKLEMDYDYLKENSKEVSENNDSGDTKFFTFNDGKENEKLFEIPLDDFPTDEKKMDCFNKNSCKYRWSFYCWFK